MMMSMHNEIVILTGIFKLDPDPPAIGDPKRSSLASLFVFARAWTASAHPIIRFFLATAATG